MKAAVRDRFGAPAEVVRLRELERPVPAEGEVLVRVRAASVNIADWYSVVGRPVIARPTMGLFRPRGNRLGTDYAGVVEELGPSVTQFAPGDEVFGGRDGAYAEYLCANVERSITPKPANVTFEEAAAVPVAALTALQAIRDHGRLEPGQKVLINGASGGVGTYAVQIAKALGGEVTAVCSTPNVETARSLGADEVVDYTAEDFTLRDERYDLLIDIAGTRPWSDCKRVLARDAIAVIVGGPRSKRLVGPLGHVVGMRLGSLPSSQKTAFFIAKFNKPDMEVLRSLLESGQLTSVIAARYELAEIADALRHQGEDHPGGKVVVTVSAGSVSESGE